MNKTEKTEIQELREEVLSLTTKMDIFFSMMANDLLSIQVSQSNNAMQTQLNSDKATEEQKEELPTLMKQSYEAYIQHRGSVNDAVDYYARIYGDEAQSRLKTLVEANPSKTQPAPTPTADVSKEAKSA